MEFSIRKNSRPRMFSLANAFDDKAEVKRAAHTSGTNTDGLANSIKTRIKHNLVNVRYYGNKEIRYSWGMATLPLSKSIVEFDNPFCLNFYNSKPGTVQRHLTKAVIKRLAAITFLSKAARDHSTDVWGNFLSDKFSEVIYPIIEPRFSGESKLHKTCINVLFVGPHGRMKGVYLANAVAKRFANEKSVKFHFVTNLVFSKSDNVTAYPELDRRTLLSVVMPKMDIFLTTSLFDSFNITILEAMSRGLPIVAIKNYATDETIIESKTGFTIENPAIRSGIFEDYRSMVAFTAKKFEAEVLETVLRDQDSVEQLTRALHCAISERRALTENQKDFYYKCFHYKEQINKLQKLEASIC